jgi:hypothetical protein
MAAEAIVIESSAVDSFDFCSSLFDPVPVDTTWMTTQFQEFNPTSSLTANSSEINFMLPELVANYCYKFYDAFLILQAKLTKEDATKPDKGSKVAPVNNIMASLFSSVEVKLNEIQVSSNNDHYNYRCYLQTLLSYAKQNKNAELQAQGYFPDQAEMFNSITNSG